MPTKMLLLLVFNVILIARNEADGRNHTNISMSNHNLAHQQDIELKVEHQRKKRFIDDVEEFKPFWANRGKKQANDKISFKGTNIDSDLDTRNEGFKVDENIRDDAPFWGNRGRRDEISKLRSIFRKIILPNRINNPNYLMLNTPRDSKLCKHRCRNKYLDNINRLIALKERRQEDNPFWGNRGRRDVGDEVVDEDPDAVGPFWGNRGRRDIGDEVVDEDPDAVGPFWGNRGRRTDDDNPFWGARGRRDDDIVKEKREWNDDDLPFWGNRGRRDDNLPFWGNRGRRDDLPFWGNRGRRDDLRSYFNAQALNYAHNKPKTLDDNSIIEMYNPDYSGFLWNKKGRDSTLNYLFGKNIGRLRRDPQDLVNIFGRNKDSETIHDDRIYAEEPYFIVLDRNEEAFPTESQPFFTSRGKKKITQDLAKAARDRRGTIADIVKSVKTDPYYIARGKKGNVQNSTIPDNLLAKTKDLICSTIDLMNANHEGNKIKREVDDNDRDRRTILKKLAAQLQSDPYFVSRGKKNKEISENDDYLYEFVKKISEMCT